MSVAGDVAADDVRAGCVIYCDGLDHPECVTVSHDGRVYAGGEAGQIYRVDGAQAHEIVTTGGSILGLACDGMGDVYACDVTRRCVWRIRPDDKTMTPFLVGSGERSLTTPNFGCFAPSGTYYCSDSGRRRASDGCIWAVQDGAVGVWTTESCNFPNGMAVTREGQRLLVVESFPPAVVEVPIRADGTAGRRRVIVELPGTVPDGIVPLEDDGFLVTCYRPDVVIHCSPKGRLDAIVEDTEGYLLAAPTNAVFMGNEQQQLLVANFGRRHLTMCVLRTRGAELYYPVVTI